MCKTEGEREGERERELREGEWGKREGGRREGSIRWKRERDDSGRYKGSKREREMAGGKG